MHVTHDVDYDLLYLPLKNMLILSNSCNQLKCKSKFKSKFILYECLHLHIMQHVQHLLEEP